MEHLITVEKSIILGYWNGRELRLWSIFFKNFYIRQLKICTLATHCEAFSHEFWAMQFLDSFCSLLLLVYFLGYPLLLTPCMWTVQSSVLYLFCICIILVTIFYSFIVEKSHLCFHVVYINPDLPLEL